MTQAMTLERVLSTLRERHVRLWTEGSVLRYEAPAGAIDEGLLASIRAHKPEILAYLDRAAGLAGSRHAIAPRPPGSDPPLSFGQERLWFLDQLESGSTAFNLQTSMRWQGPLRVSVLERSLNDVVSRHEGLRTTFPAVDGAPRLAVAPSSTQRLPVIDLTRLPAARRQAESRRCRRGEMSRPFDLAVGPLLRCRLLRLVGEEHLLIVTVHHIVTDHWSNVMLRRELRQIYQARVESRPPALPNLNVQYADYALWQRQWLSSARAEPMLAYWREKLRDEPQRLDLPFDRPRPPALSSRGASCGMVLRGPLPDALQALSQAAGASLFMTLLGALKVLLLRATGQHDLCVGTPIAGRDHNEVEGLIGFFLNTLVLRSDLSGEPTFHQALARVRQVALEAYDFQEIPFEKLLEEQQPQRDLSRNSLFQAYCNLVQSAPGENDLDDYWATLASGSVGTMGGSQEPAALEVIESTSALARFDLDLHLIASPGRLDVVLSCKQDLFDTATVRRMLSWYRTLLESVAADPERPISTLPLLDAAARRELEGGRNRVHPASSGAAFPADAVEQTVTARFEQQVGRAPEHVAVRTLERSWTYRQLDRAANRVARALQARVGESGGARVALLFSPGGTFLEGLLGVLKAGHTYVPLDPSYPEARLRFMLADSQAVAIVAEVAQAELARTLAGNDKPVMLVDRLPEVSAEPVACSASPDSLAYILYTSGSTGQPKGVMQSHRNLLGHARAYVRALRIAPEDRLTLLSSYTFDAAAMDVYGALLSGATVCPLPLRDLTIGDLLAAMADFRVTIYHSTPSVFRYLFAGCDDQAPRLPRVRLVVLGGEETRRGDLELYRRYVGPPPEGGRQRFDRQCLLVNGLGPTESTLALQFFMDCESRTDRRRVAVGYGVPGTSVELLSRGGVAGEVLGEIALRGAYLALGYWRRPRRTAMTFVPAPGGGRLYRSGDLGRLRADGALEFVGRKDAQVKVRGFRIEPGEVETALVAHPAVSAAAVVAVADRSGDNRLAAYIVSVPGTAVTASDLRPFLRERLPEMLVPSTYTRLDVLPLTPNGKLDRRALPEPAVDRGASEHGYVAPRDSTEEQLASIWQDLLEVERIGVHDDFFDLGGHSLLAMRLLAVTGRAFDIELPVRSIFEAPTIERFAAGLPNPSQGLQRAEAARPAPPPIRPRVRTVQGSGDDDQPLPLSFGQERLWFLDQLEPGSTAFNLQITMHWQGPLQVAVLEQSLHDVVSRHEGLRTTFPAVDGSPRQQIAPPTAQQLSLIDISRLPIVARQTEIRRWRHAETFRAFDLVVGPLLRARLLCLIAGPAAEEEHLLLVTLHHIVSDHGSNEMFRHELREIYQARLASRPPTLLALPIQYADYALWQRQWLRDEHLERGLAYWRKKLGDEPPKLDLPFDRPRPSTLSSRGASCGMVLEGPLPESLRVLSQGLGASLFMTLLAVLKVLLMRITGEPDLCVGTPIAGRNHDDVKELIGFFLNTLVLRSDLSGEPTFKEAVTRVRQVALEAYDHQEIPFEKLLAELQPRRDLGRNPLFQAYCNMVHRAPGQNDQAGYWVTPSTAERAGTDRQRPAPEMVESSGIARFDLDLHLMAGPGRLDIVLSCKRDLFDAATVHRMLGWYRTLLESVAANPERQISALPLLAAAERRELEASHNPIRPPGTGSAFPAQAVEQAVTARFGQQVARAPGQVAIRTLERSWTYAQLDRASNRVARALNGRLGMAGGERVALLFNPGGTFLEGLLGVLKSGHAYVPLDPSYPEARLRFVLADSQTSAIVTESAQAELARTLAGDDQPVMLVDRLPEVSAEPVACPASPDSLAYILYTSGSTGQPKGVMQNHRNLLGHARAYARSLHIAPEDRLTLLSSYTFDAAAMDVYGALLSGATVCPLPLRHLTTCDLLTAMADFGISIYHSTPSVFRYLFSSDGDRERLLSPLSRIRMVVLGGEETRRGDLELYREYVCPPAGGNRRFDRQCLLVNGLGPTEATLALQFFIDRETRMDRRRVAVGYGVPGTSVDLLSRGGAVGEVLGEIALRGAYVALGYWRRPRRTALAFMPAAGGGRVYRTGDLGRLRADGALEFVGRKDAQVKIRGYRIEPGEVETALIAHPAVHAAVVVAVADRSGENQLAAYIVSATETETTVSDLRLFLRERLPEMLVPSSFTHLDVLPLTPNGKLDRRALPAPTVDREASEHGYVAPRDPIEEQLAAIWQDLLGVERVGIHDDFFDLGGHSLLAMRLLAVIGRTFDVELPVRSIFDAPTVAAQEMELTRRLAGSQDEAELARMIEEVEGLSEEELRSMLEAEA